MRNKESKVGLTLVTLSLLNYRSIIGTRLDATSYVDACNRIQTWVNSGLSCYVVAANVHVVMSGYWCETYRRLINNAGLITPDGMPLVWALRLLGIKQQTRVYGPDLMLAWCDRASRTGIPIYLYGGTPSTLDKLETNLKRQFPHLIIAGSYSPPFRPFTKEEEAHDRELIQRSGAKVVLVGLGCPKQEEWMSRQQGHLNAVMIGVGAAFRFHSGEVSQAPRWMMGAGLEWLYRLFSEPRRLWQRYLINNPCFVVLFAWQLLQSWRERFVTRRRVYR
ncbi:MAG: WecB/TagA/CpsF family glycosyltransferase [Chlorogloea purpurea SAG 13.99]|nr:WecB/TagA/CpsF family glycosyltransferase [Chlorogloea purpurea SAG 13.99]